MLIDRQLRFGSAQAITAATASTDLIDLATANRDLGVGTPLWFVAVVTTAFTDGGSNSTLTVALETDTADSFGSAVTAQTCGTFAALAAVGDRICVPVQPFAADERFIRVYYTPNNGDLSAGAVTAFLTTDPHNWVARPDGFTIS